MISKNTLIYSKVYFANVLEKLRLLLKKIINASLKSAERTIV